MVFAINAFDPTKAVSAMGEGIRTAWLKLHSNAGFYFLLKGFHADTVDGVFGFGIFAVNPVTIITLYCDHMFSHFQHVFEADKAKIFSAARVGAFVAVRHGEATTN